MVHREQLNWDPSIVVCVPCPHSPPRQYCRNGADVLHCDVELTRLSYGAGMQPQRMGMQPQQQQQGPPFLQSQQGAAQSQQQPRLHIQHPGPHLISGQGPRPAQQQLQAGHTYIMRPSQAQVQTRHFPLANDHCLAFLHHSSVMHGCMDVPHSLLL